MFSIQFNVAVQYKEGPRMEPRSHAVLWVDIMSVGAVLAIMSGFQIKKRHNGSAYACSLYLQKSLYLHTCLYPVWVLVIAFFLNSRFYTLATLSRYLSTTALMATVSIEVIRIYLGYCGNLYNQVPELAGFWMLTVLMQVPLMSFFLFNPYLYSTPMELTLHCVLYIFLLSQIVLGYYALKQASAHAKRLYLSHAKLNRNEHS